MADKRISDLTTASALSGAEPVPVVQDSATVQTTTQAIANLAPSHNHAASQVTSGTFADARIAQSSVVQHEAALTVTESQISDLGAYISGASPSITTPALILRQGAAPSPTVEGEIWWDSENDQLRVGNGSGTTIFSDAVANAASFAETGHGHSLSDIIDAGALASKGSIAASDIDDGAVTLAKLSDMSGSAFIGRATAGVGALEVMDAAAARGLLNVEDGAEPNEVDDVFGLTGSVNLIALGEKVTPDDSDWLVVENTAGGTFNKVQIGNLPDPALDDLTDVAVATPFDNHVLAYDSGSGSWINQSPAGAGLSEAGHGHAHGTMTGLSGDDHLHYVRVDATRPMEILSLAEDGTPGSSDWVHVENNAGGTHRKVQLANLPGGGGGETNTASNVGTAGVGVFKQKTGVDLEFKKINAGSSKIVITDDSGNNEIDVDVTEANLTLDNLGGTLGVSKGGTGASTAAGARTALDVDQAGTDNSTPVTLAGTPDYITLSGQVITRNPIDLAADVTGNLAVGNLASGSGADATTFFRGDGTWATPGGGGGTDPIVELTASGGAASLGSTTCFTGSYKGFWVFFECEPDTDNKTLELELYADGAFKTTGYGGSSSTEINCGNNWGNDTNEGGGGWFYINNPAGTTYHKFVHGMATYKDRAAVFGSQEILGGYQGSLSAVTGFRLQFVSSSNITGRALVLGVKHV